VPALRQALTTWVGAPAINDREPTSLRQDR
jgi:hypothetical protein